MKKLIISLKTSTQVLDDFKKAFQDAKNGNLKDHFEISFDNKRDFEKFIRNISILRFIIHYKPHSIYELSKLLEKDISNLNKIIQFYENLGVIIIKKNMFDGREVNKPIVKYEKIEFNLAA
ncbi:MAG TPA: hypothetical protein DC049_01495 [Spirochaetia bacterium]|nr:hypothetical protein [Spirochaetia bacterium]